jgi:dipeptidyl-peptidase 4
MPRIHSPMHARDARLAAAFVFVALVALAPAVSAQQASLTLEHLYDPETRLAVPAPHRVGQEVARWLGDTRVLRAAPDPEAGPGAFVHVVIDVETGAASPLFDVAGLEAALSRVPGVAPADAARLARLPAYTFDPAVTGLLVTVNDDLHWWTFGSEQVVRLTQAPGTEHDAAFSPDGRLVGFTRDHNLFVVDLRGHERALTSDGHEGLLNGRLDWLYQEEIYGRGNWRAFWWSPDSTRLAYLQLDQSRVPRFSIVDDIPYRQAVEVMRYPKAGDPNPTVRLGIVRATGGATTWVDLASYGGTEILLVRVGWTPDSRRVVYQVQDREQTWLDLNVARLDGRSAATVLREVSPAWVVPLGTPEWLPDGTFLWASQRSGWTHLYRYRLDGTLVSQVTSGTWDVRTSYGVSPDAQWVYFSGTERSYIGQDVYRVALDGTSLVRLSATAGTHDATFNPSFTRYAGRWSDVTTPPELRIHSADGTEERLLERPANVLAGFDLAAPEFLQVPTRDGFAMEAMILKPRDFDARDRYPVYQHTYAGPGAPQVRNAWGGVNYLFHQLLAQHGIVVWVCDNRSATAKGAQSAWPVYQRLGELELQDIEDGIAWLRRHRWVDDRRIGLNGWSYGGFITMYALTHSRSFAMGIAGGGVSDWRDYDTVYTERYMRLPQHNPDGYVRTAPRWAAGRLSAPLLLLHGMLDDNVHLQNTVQFAYELQRAGKPFELMLYPRSRHAITDPRLALHQRRTMLDFIMRTLRPAAGPASPEDAPNPTP